MAIKAFYSFHYEPDNWRASQVRNVGSISGNATISDNDWEKVKRGGEKAIKSWIDDQLKGRSCTIVLIGSKTAGRKWIDYEIRESWNNNKGVLGIHIHNLKDIKGVQSPKGKNPFDSFTIGNEKVKMSSVVKTYDPPFKTSTYVYDNISTNISAWVDEAIRIRKNYK
ncbi:TIR domain-containing protein [Saccharibacillus qingshengii]|uniref:TIR domain-containing protein n=1 Tax=Saccharibacillus qingshengii TaxID=1763540 RepID=UPI0015565EC7|nr:TIR domain-containing protein [Saccharibacillus qingshengii]